MAAKVFVGNLNFSTTKTEVQDLFSQVGAIRDVFLPMDRESGRPRGFAFVEFASDEDAAKAIEKFNGYELSGRALRVNAAEDRPRSSGPRPGGGGGGGGYGGGGYGGGGYGGGGGGSYEGGGGYDRDDYSGGGYGGGGNKNKGSRRNIRAKKRSL
ncbi:MAG: RNA recognition motif domain-containing protein [Thermoanaerobaculia bacterium]